MDIEPEQHHLAKLIHEHVSRYPETDTGNSQLLPTIYDYMGAFKSIMDSTSRIEMDFLCANYPGFYRFGKLLELIAEGIQSGSIEVPKDH